MFLFGPTCYDESMCLTIPGKILSIADGAATIQSSREKVQIDLGLVFGAKVGDWLLYATNRAVKLISESDAKEIISLLEDNYSTIDVSRLPLEFKKIIYKVRSRNTDLTKNEIEYLFSLKGKNNLETLYAEANTLRKDRIDDFVCIHGIIEFSNYCRNNCLYCGLRKDNKNIQHYRINQKEIIKIAKEAVGGEGYKLLVLQSGEDMTYSDKDLIEIVRNIKKQVKVFIFLSVGNRSRGFYKDAFLAGATGTLFRFETSNKKMYEKMHPGETFDDRISLLKYQMELGYYVASGSLVGLPKQTISDIADDLLLTKKLGIPMISSGPFLPAKGTPLTNYNNKTSNSERIESFLKYIAIARFLMPEIKIPVTTALETLDPKNGRHRGLLAGANALMFNLTPEKYAGKYSIYDDKYREREKVWQKYGLFKGEESYEMLEERLMIK
jgi:biotin synthase